MSSSRVLITGAGGLVASALVSFFENVFALRHAALDIADAAAVDAVVDRVAPDLIVNCAVVGVDVCEKEPALAERVNVDGTANLARAASRAGAAMLHFSSNYVFGGDRDAREPYTIDDEPRPINVYGRTKLAGERSVLDACDRAFIVRTSWVYGAGKDSFLSTVAVTLRRGERVQAIRDTWANTTFAGDLARRVHEILERGEPGVYQVVNEGLCSYETFAREAASLVRANPSLIDVVTEASMHRLAPRPKCTPMRCLLSERLALPRMRPWQDALGAFIGSTAGGDS